jgi:hypothetical protein
MLKIKVGESLIPSSNISLKSYQGTCIPVNRADPIFIKKLTFDGDEQVYLRLKTKHQTFNEDVFKFGT